MNQIIVEFWVLGNDSRVDFLLPTGIPIIEMLEEIRAQIEASDTSVSFDRTQVCIVCDVERHLLLDCAKSLAENGVCNGSCLSIC